MNEKNEMEKKKASKFLRSWNLRPNLDLAITFSALFLVIFFEDLILIFIYEYPTQQ